MTGPFFHVKTPRFRLAFYLNLKPCLILVALVVIFDSAILGAERKAHLPQGNSAFATSPVNTKRATGKARAPCGQCTAPGSPFFHFIDVMPCIQ